MEFKEFWLSMSGAKRKSFAERCKTSVGHLNNVAYGLRSCAESLAINIDRESGGEVRCESMRPDVDWAHLRGSGLSTTKRKCG